MRVSVGTGVIWIQESMSTPRIAKYSKKSCGDVRAAEMDTKWGSHWKSLGIYDLEGKKAKVIEYK